MPLENMLEVFFRNAGAGILDPHPAVADRDDDLAFSFGLIVRRLSQRKSDDFLLPCLCSLPDKSRTVLDDFCTVFEIFFFYSDESAGR